MGTVTSADGTVSAFEEHGPEDAPAVVHVHGATAHRVVQPSPAHIAEVAGGDLRVIVFDRRGRGDSGDTEPYAVRREVEDIAALVDHAGGRAVLLGEKTFPFLPPAAAALVDVLPDGELRQVPTADHTLTPEAAVPVLRELA